MIDLYEGGQRITSPFGPRELNGKEDNHKGIDVVGLKSKMIISPVNAVVIESSLITDKNNSLWQRGNYIIIDDQEGFEHYFYHLRERFVARGYRVKEGEIIGTEGNTGYSFGSHLHYGIKDKKSNTFINPEVFWAIKETERELEKKMKRYNTVEECPDYAKETIQLLVDNKILLGDGKGLKLSEDMIRIYVTNNRAGLYSHLPRANK